MDNFTIKACIKILTLHRQVIADCVNVMKPGPMKHYFFLVILLVMTGGLCAQCSANFTASNNCQFSDVPFTFTGSAGQPRFSWNFGDGFSNFNTDTVRHPVHRFNRDGVFTVTLIVTDTGGCSDTVSKNIRILKKPEAAFTVTQPCAGLGTQFRSLSTMITSYMAGWHME